MSGGRDLETSSHVTSDKTFFFIYIYLAVLGLNCGMQTLSDSM